MKLRNIARQIRFTLAALTWLPGVLAGQEPVTATGGNTFPAPLPPAAGIVIHHPVSGTVFRAPKAIVFEATAVDPKGDIRHLEFFANDTFIGASDFLAKIATIPGNPIPHRFEWSEPAPGGYAVVARAKDTDGNPVESAPVKIQILAGDVPGAPALVKPGADWRYSNDGSIPQPGWQTLDFDDAAWPVGPAQLGYGDGDEATVTPGGKLVPHPMTAYFRHRFVTADTVAAGKLVVRLVRDDGAAVYLNGRELLRDNLPAGLLTPATPAAGQTGEENAWHRFVVPADALVVGNNIVAVEVHQSNPLSSDLSFDLELLALSAGSADLPLVSVEASRADTAEPGPTVRAMPGQFTLRRTGDTSEPLAVWLKTGGTATAKVDYEPLPENAKFPAGRAELVINVTAAADEMEEADESVVLQVVESPLDSLPTYSVDAGRSAAKVVIHDTPPIRVARLAITSPATGAFFGWGEAIPIQAVAVDPAGYVARVEFLADGQSIGVSDLTFITAPPAGQPLRHHFDWKGAMPGAHLLITRATTAAGGKLESAPVRVSVRSESTPVVVTVVAKDPEGSEGRNAEGIADPATFLIRRHGAVDIDLPVFFKLSGSAKNGTDFVEVADRVVIPQGEDSATVVINPIADNEVEGTETVVLQLQSPVCPLIFPPPPTCYQVGEPGAAKVVIHDNEQPRNHPPQVELTQPRDGAVLDAPAELLLLASASDPDGYSTLKQVEFFADGQSLGVRENLPTMSPLGPFVLTWKEVPIGRHKLYAIATDDAGMTGASKSVVIEVVDAGAKPTVSVTAPDPEAQEPMGGREWAMPNLGSFMFTRTGPVAKELKVTYEVGGTAENGKDYVRLGGDATIRAGARSRAIYVLPLADRLPEGKETVVVKLVAQETYAIGEAREATVTVIDSPSPADEVVIRITAPENDAVFAAPATIEIQATATDPAGFIYDLEFYADGRSIGESNLRTLVAPPPGTPAEHALTWKEVRPGTYWITARANRSGRNPLFSPPVKIRVTGAPADGFVVRTLPAWYAPGSACWVRLAAEPAEGAKAYGIEDAPPAGWKVTEVSDEGVFDAINHKVKFGPFFDQRARRLNYKAIPPTDATGPAEFRGLGSVDGVDSVIGGDTLVNAAPSRHPADRGESDSRLTAAEVSAYGAAWRKGEDWAVAPNSIPMNYLTRAARIWRQGELYRYDPTAGTPPLCWVPVAAEKANPAAAITATEPAEAVRHLSVVVVPGQPTVVQLTVEADASGAPLAVEERIPADWLVTAVSDDGHWDASRGVIRWGPFNEAKRRELRYTVTPPVSATGLADFEGWLSADGRDRLIGGGKKVVCSRALADERNPGVHRVPDGGLLVNLLVPTGPQYVIEVSTDLLNWTPLATALTEDGVVPWMDTEAAHQSRRFYRAVPAR